MGRPGRRYAAAGPRVATASGGWEFQGFRRLSLGSPVAFGGDLGVLGLVRGVEGRICPVLPLEGRPGDACLGRLGVADFGGCLGVAFGVGCWVFLGAALAGSCFRAGAGAARGACGAGVGAGVWTV